MKKVYILAENPHSFTHHILQLYFDPELSYKLVSNINKAYELRLLWYNKMKKALYNIWLDKENFFNSSYLRFDLIILKPTWNKLVFFFPENIPCDGNGIEYLMLDEGPSNNSRLHCKFYKENILSMN